MPFFNQPSYHLNDTLSAEQISFFQKQGYIHFKNFISKETVQNFLAELQQVQDYLIRNNIDKVNGIPLKFGQNTDGSLLIQRLAFASQYSAVLSGFLKDARLRSLLQLLEPYNGRIGEYEKDGLVVNHYVNTATSAFTQLGWHTDSPRDLFLGSRILPMLNVGLHLDDCLPKMAGLGYCPAHIHKVYFAFFSEKNILLITNQIKKRLALK